MGILYSGKYSTQRQLNDKEEAVTANSSYYHIKLNRWLSILSPENSKRHSFWNTVLFFAKLEDRHMSETRLSKYVNKGYEFA